MIFIPMMLFELSMGNFIKLIGLTCLYILLEINRKIMEIKFVGNNLHIHPVYTIISLYLGLKIYGLWGVILGPFIIILIMEIFNYYYTGKERGMLL
jgi:predicted PurR-regulated permease PerM